MYAFLHTLALLVSQTPSPETVDLARVLITAPGTVTYNPTKEEWPSLSTALWHVVLEEELLDIRSREHYFADIRIFWMDLSIVRKNYVKFRNAPKLSQLHGFPAVYDCRWRIEENLQARKELEALSTWNLDRRHSYSKSIKCLEARCEVWVKAEHVANPMIYTTARREYAMELIRILGPERFFNYDFPSHLPE